MGGYSSIENWMFFFLSFLYYYYFAPPPPFFHLITAVGMPVLALNWQSVQTQSMDVSLVQFLSDETSFSSLRDKGACPYWKIVSRLHLRKKNCYLLRWLLIVLFQKRKNKIDFLINVCLWCKCKQALAKWSCAKGSQKLHIALI